MKLTNKCSERQIHIITKHKREANIMGKFLSSLISWCRCFKVLSCFIDNDKEINTCWCQDVRSFVWYQWYVCVITMTNTCVMCVSLCVCPCAYIGTHYTPTEPPRHISNFIDTKTNIYTKHIGVKFV